MESHILNVSFFAAQADVPQLMSALKSSVAPIIGGISHSWLRLERLEGHIPQVDEPRSIALQCRFADRESLEAFRLGTLREAVERLHALLPAERCMVFHTELERINL